jgi:hypothetical protein
MNITVALGIVLVIVMAGAGGEAFLLKKSYERNAALEASNTALIGKVKEINDTLRKADEIHQTNNALPDDKLFDGLLAVPADSQR